MDKAILEMNGLEDKKAEKKEAKVKVCPRCDAINDVNDVYCSKCSFILDEKEAVKIDSEKKDEEQMTLIAKRVLEKLSQRIPEVKSIIAEEMRNLK